jgi:hypothetical protein
MVLVPSGTHTKCVTGPTVHSNTCVSFAQAPIPKSDVPDNQIQRKAPQQPKHTHINRLPISIKSEVFARELFGYDPKLYKSLLSGFREGFKLGVEGEKLQCNFCNAKNHKSALENPDKVLEKLAKESLKSRIAGPFKNFVSSPLGLVPKAVNGKFRLIHDLSYPKVNSVNSLIPPENSEVKYDCIDNVIKLVKYFGRDSYLGKTDVEDAFRNIDIHPSDYHLLGFTWNGFYYYDKCLAMGATSSCQIFENFSFLVHYNG